MIERLPQLCLYRRWTGRMCFGCGLTHSVSALLHGQISASWHWNRLGVFILPAALAAVLSGMPVSAAQVRKHLAALEIPRDQARCALRRVWAVLSIVFALVLLSSAILPEELAMRLAPVCQRKAATGRECPLCGMTHDFLAISRGRLRVENRRNRASLPLYAGMLANEALFALNLTLGRRLRAPVPTGRNLESLGRHTNTIGETSC